MSAESMNGQFGSKKETLDLSDNDLIRQMLDSATDRDKYERLASLLVSRYENYILTVLRKRGIHNDEDLEDASQDVWRKIFNSLKNFDFRHENTFTGLLSKTTQNTAIDLHRRKRSERSQLGRKTSLFETNDYGEDIPLPKDNSAASADDILINAQDRQAIREALPHLTNKHRELIEKIYLDDLSYREVSDELGIIMGTLKGRIFRAKDQLRKILKREELL